ncbi:MAG TPA: alpha/beta hydrolase [Marmoricola sp.]|jgi:pimeloyl-ACP methyl ester carboxylesterase|nr:alpha/beta hydrolase [Marmoricola sp.]
MSTRLPDAARAWREDGRTIDVAGRDVFVHDSGEGPEVTVVIHGFPSCSYDWVEVVGLLDGRVIALDLPGYGFSDKSPDASYSLFDQADVVEAVLAELGVERCSIVAHDMGDTVTAELACRANAGELGFALERIVLTNGSIFIDMAQLTRGQRLTLRLPARRSMFSMPTPLLRRSLLESFTRTAPPPAGAIGGLIALIQYDGGDRLLPLLIRYIEERRAHQDRWTAGFVDFAGPLTLVWGTEDPIAVVAMTARMAELRPTTSVVLLDGTGHWPSLECPDRLASEIRTALSPAG